MNTRVSSLGSACAAFSSAPAAAAGHAVRGQALSVLVAMFLTRMTWLSRPAPHRVPSVARESSEILQDEIQCVFRGELRADPNMGHSRAGSDSFERELLLGEGDDAGDPLLIGELHDRVPAAAGVQGIRGQPAPVRVEGIDTEHARCAARSPEHTVVVCLQARRGALGPFWPGQDTLACCEHLLALLAGPASLVALVPAIVVTEEPGRRYRWR